MRIKMYRPLALLCLCIFIAPVNAFSQVEADYSGCVTSEKNIFSPPPSLLQLLKSATVKPCAYKFATALTQSHLISIQQEQKERLLKSIQQLYLNSSSEPIKQYLFSLKSLIQKQPVTGRVLGLELNSTRVEIIPLKNRVFSRDLKIYFPKKLKSIFFLGAQKQTMLYRPVLTVDDYLMKNPLFDFFEKGYVSVIQANGEVETIKVGYWNHQSHYVSPGGWIIGRLDSDEIENIAPSFNEDLTHWLATQVLP